MNIADTYSERKDVAANVEQATDESRIVQRARRGDTNAFEALYRAHAGRVYALCLRLTGNAEEAKEMTQVAFIRAWEKMWSFRGSSAFGTWLYRLTVNVVLTERRSRTRREARFLSTDTFDPFERATHTARPGMRMDLESAMRELPEGARTVFVLHDVEGYKHHEIAAQLGVTEGASKAQLHRARKLLRKALEA